MITKTDEVSGIEVPKKCCENCWKNDNSHLCIKKNDSDIYMYYEGGWSNKVDSCSRHEFKESEE